MTPEERELLFKDLCARLPYGVKLGFYASATKQTYICTLLGLVPQEDEPIIAKTENGNFYMLADNVKPYLFPLSSMTEEQERELFKLFGISLVDSIGADYIKINEYAGITFFLNKGFDIETHLDKLIDWCNRNHFDYRGLIEKGLAIDATSKNIY